MGEREDRGSYSHREVRKDHAVRKVLGLVPNLCASIRMGYRWEPNMSRASGLLGSVRLARGYHAQGTLSHRGEYAKTALTYTGGRGRAEGYAF